MSIAFDAHVVPESMQNKLCEVRRRQRMIGMGTAICGTLALLVTAVMGAMLVDRMMTLFDPMWRTALTLVTLATAAVTFLLWTALVLLRGRRAVQLARDVDRSLPNLEERWSTITQVHASTNGSAPQPHAGMLQQVTSEAVAWDTAVDPCEVVSPRRLYMAIAAFVFVEVVLLAVLVLDSSQTWVLLQRFMSPQSNISLTQITGIPSEMVAVRGEPLTIIAALEGRSVPKAKLTLRDSDGADEQLLLFADTSNPPLVQHRIRAVEEPFDFRLRAGDGQTAWTTVLIADRPELAMVELRLTPPAYTGQATQRVGRFPRRISAIQGSVLEVAFKPKNAVESLRLQLTSNGDRDDKGRWLQLDADDEGWYRFRHQLKDGITLSPVLTESHGITNRRPPKCRIAVYMDNSPVVEVTSPETDIAVRSDDIIDVEFTAEDDFGIVLAELVVYKTSEEAGGEPRELKVIDIPLGAQKGMRAVQGTVALDLAELGLKDGENISYEVRVSDTRQSVEFVDAAKKPAPADSKTAPNSGSDSRGQTKTGQTADAKKDRQAASDPANRADDRNTDRSNGGETSAQNDQKADSRDEADKKTSTIAVIEQPAVGRTANLADRMQDATGESDSPPGESRQASSERRSVTTENESGASENRASNNRQPSEGESSAQPGSQSSAGRSSPSGSSDEVSSESSPPDDMPRRSLDVAQTASSDPMRLTIDEYAGSFEGQRRRKLELAIAPFLESLDDELAKAEAAARYVLDQSEQQQAWQVQQDRDVDSADKRLQEAEQIISRLQRKSRETPYTLIGLQLVDIGQSHVTPARDELWAALQVEPAARAERVRDAWQHIGRARDLLARLTEQFERVRREHRLADKIQQVKKMYQVFIEDTVTLLQPELARLNSYNRKMAEFELDDEYLARLKEVLEMRRELSAELARILSEDPRLLRRYMDLFARQSETLRDQLTLLARRQITLRRELKAWLEVTGETRPSLEAAIAQQRLQEATEIAKSAGDLYDRFLIWLPLDREVEDGALADAQKRIAAIAATAQKLREAAMQASADQRAAALKAEETLRTKAGQAKVAGDSATRTASGGNRPQAAPSPKLEALGKKAIRMYRELRALDAALRRVSLEEDRPDVANHVVNRLLDTRRLIERTSGWIRKVKDLEQGNYARVLQIGQHQLAADTRELTDKLANIEQQLAGVIQREDGSLTTEIAEKARALLDTMESRVEMNQLAAVYALRSLQLQAAAGKQAEAVEAFAAAEQLFDELMVMTIEEADKLPVQDPIADLLDDPTLDELLAALENEGLLDEILGIPRRPSNLRIIGDWLRPGSGGSGPGSVGQMVPAMIRNEEQEAQRRLDRAHRQAVSRALKDREAATLHQNGGMAPTNDVRWNKLVSELESQLLQGRGKQPPERYRRAISQYFDIITRPKSTDDSRQENK